MTSKEKMLKKMRENTQRINEHYAVAPANFLKAWKEAAIKIGSQYFECQRGFTIPIETAAATDKWQLIPNINAMAERVNVCSVGEGVFMAAVISFYNGETGENFMHQFQMFGLGDIAGRLDLDEVDIITRLMFNHTGW